MRRQAAFLFLFSLFGSVIFAQGLNTTASKDDWEEINYEFNSSILTDGYPSLLRLADLLHAHQDYKVKLEGHADKVGSNRYNDRLGKRRADTVKAFLVKYGAADGQITTESFGKRQPKVSNGSKEGRFMNRRVTVTVTDASGKVISAGSVGEAINAMSEGNAAMKKCCDDILKRLDRLDEIADLLRRMQGENDNLRSQLKNLQDQQNALDQYVRGMPKPLTSSETAAIVDTRTAEQIEKARMPRFSLLGINAGLDGDGNFNFTGGGRFFAPFKEQFAFQAQGEYMYFHDRKEGQIDFGLVDRFLPRAQFGVFNSFKHVDLRGMNSGGTLGQASATLDYLFSRGRIGIFGAKGYMNSGMINRAAVTINGVGPQGPFSALSTTTFDESYLSVIDQIGGSATVGLFGRTYLEGNLGYLKSKGYADRPGGTLKFVFPMSDRFAFTLQGDVNPTLVGPGNTGQVLAGFQFGNFQSPKDYLEGIKGIQHAVPADIPRVRYEVLTRRVSTGHVPPVADAGPDQIGVPAGTITLNGSGSYSPEGRPITCQWVQIAGSAVTINNALTCTANFTAASGQSYSFRLLVRDDTGAQSIARTTVTTTTPTVPVIERFVATPNTIQPGQNSVISWQVQNATSVTVTNIGQNLGLNGNYTVTPANTTQYVLTATNAAGSVQAVTTVTVQAATVSQASFGTCTVSPSNIMAGESATITYTTNNATSVSLSPGVGTIAGAGQQVVSPTQTTTYTLTANGPSGSTPTTCQVTVSVTSGTAPRIVSFVGNPLTITAGQSSTLTWNVENATSVSISGLGTVAASGTQTVTPATTTTYTLTATNQFGNVTAQQTITVNPAGGNTGGPVAIAGCAATPSTVTAANTAVSIAYNATNATSVTIAGLTGVTVAGPVSVTPTQTTTYNIVAHGANNTTATCSVTVTVNIAPTTPPPTAIIAGPSTIETLSRFVTLDASQSVNPAGGALTYTWQALGTGAAILDQGQPVTRVQLGGLFGDYVFRVTVTNAAGQSDSTTVTVRFVNVNPH